MTHTLTHHGTYKDGGSRSFKDEHGNDYWQDFSISSRNTKKYGLIYKGNINDAHPILADGHFVLKVKIYRKKNEIMEVIEETTQ